MADEPTLYLIWHDPAAAPAEPIDLHGDGHPLADGLWLVRSALTRSKLYHRIKWQLPDGTALLCAPLGTTPMAGPSSRGWMRARWRGCAGIRGRR